MDTQNGCCSSRANFATFRDRDFGAGRAMRIILRKLSVVFLASFLVLAAARTSYAQPRKTLTQLSTIGALVRGVYDGEMTIQQLKRYGNTGLGTFNAVDGEMIMLDGTAYQVRSDGSVRIAKPGEETPSAEVTFFQANLEKPLPRSTGMKELTEQIDALLPTRNLIYVLKIEGIFKEVTARSVPRQHKPYELLTEIVKSQPIFKFRDVKGTVVGIRCPAFMEGINVPGYHLHFLTADRRSGGHVLDISVSHAVVMIDAISDFHMILPRDQEFYKANLEENMSGEVKTVESEKK
ncbi:MAG: acetolactate decarboxylase [Acidobacteria bacterium]|nr:acetolactate decarboxylase [Acidobacteriota bacterium]